MKVSRHRTHSRLTAVAQFASMKACLNTYYTVVFVNKATDQVSDAQFSHLREADGP